MTRDELISFYSNEYAPKYIDASIDAKVRSEIERLAYKAGINSNLNKDLQELAVIEGQLYTLKETGKQLSQTVSFANMGAHKYIALMIEQLETTRTELLNKLNLEG